MKKSYGLMFLICILSLPLLSLAHPISCYPRYDHFQKKTAVLNFNSKSTVPKIYYLNNISRQTILLNHTVKNPHASAGWDSTLQPHHWSALLLSQKNFPLQCVRLKNNKMQTLDCRKVLLVCESRFTVAGRNQSYWLVENKQQNEFIKSVKKRLKNPSKGQP